MAPELVKGIIADHKRDARISREKAATHFGTDRATYEAQAAWHDAQVVYWEERGTSDR